MKNIKFIHIFLFGIITFFVFNSTLAQSVTDITNLFPYQINFSEKEKAYLKSLSKEEIQKLVELAKSTKTKNFGKQVPSTTPTTTSPTTLLQTLPYDLSQILKGNFSNPALPRDQFGKPIPMGDTSEGSPFSPIQSGPLSQILGNNQTYFPRVNDAETYKFDDTKLKEAFTSEELASCPNYGIAPGAGGNPRCLSPKVKLDTTKLCTLTGKKLVIDSGYRSPGRNPAGTGSQHIYGKAMDTDFRGWSQEEKVIGVLYFMAHCYTGMGVYGANHNIHIDHRTPGELVTFPGGTMRWGKDRSNGSCRGTPAPQYVIKAFSLMGIDRCAVPQRMVVINRAIDALKKLGKDKFVPKGKTEAEICAGIQSTGCH